MKGKFLIILLALTFLSLNLKNDIGKTQQGCNDQRCYIWIVNGCPFYVCEYYPSYTCAYFLEQIICIDPETGQPISSTMPCGGSPCSPFIIVSKNGGKK